MLKTASCATIPDLVSQFADNCAGLWRNREHAAQSRTYDASLRDLDELDERVDAQIEGLRTTGNEGWRIAAENIEAQGAGGIFTAAVLAFESCSPHREVGDEVETLFSAIEKPELALRPLSLALDWIDPARLPLIVERLSAESEPCCVATKLMARSRGGLLSLQRAISGLETGAPLSVRVVCEAALATGDRALLRPVEAHLESEDREVAEIVARTALTLGSRRAVDVLSARASQGDLADAEIAAKTLFRSLEPRHALTMHRTVFREAPPTRASVQAAGAAAIRELVPVLLESMEGKTLARLAAEMFCTMTGADLKRDLLCCAPPEEADAGPNSDPEDENVDMDADEGKLWPDRALVAAWWELHVREFQPGTRYLGGVAVHDEMLRSLLREGPQRVRATAAELLSFNGNPLFDVRAPAFRQMQRLAGEGAWR